MEPPQALWDAARTGDIETLALALETTGNGFCFKTDADHRTAFHWACASNQLEAAELLLQYKSDLNHQDDGWSPLHSSCSAGHFDIVKFLVDHQAKIDLKTASECIPLHYAAAKGHLSIVKCLVEAGSPINDVDKYGNTPLIKSVSSEKLKVAEFLLNSGSLATVKERSTGDTSLHIAVKNDDAEMCLLLCSSAKDLPFVKNEEGETPYDIAGKAMKAILKDYVAIDQ